MKIKDNGLFLTIKTRKFKVVLCDVGASVYDIVFFHKHMVSTWADKISWAESPKIYYGKTAGRICGRVQNGKLQFQDAVYSLDLNDGKNSLHGGIGGISTRLFKHSISQDGESVVVKYSYFSKDLEEGYPGNVEISVIYTISTDYSIKIEFVSKSDIDTPIDLTNHLYYNLGGEINVLNQKLSGNVEGYFFARNDTTVDSSKVCKFENVNFHDGFAIKDLINEPFVQKFFQKGIDHCFVWGKGDHVLNMSSEKFSMKLSSDYPCFQMYSENFPKDVIMNNLIKTQLHGSIAIEPQEVPNDFASMTSAKGVTKHRWMKIEFAKESR